MADPAVATHTHGSDGPGLNSFVVALPAGVQRGDMLVLAFAGQTVLTSARLHFPAGWTSGTGNATGLHSARILWRIADGTEGASITVTTDDSCGATWAFYRITGATAFAVTQAPGLGGGVNPDSPLLALPFGGAAVWLSIATTDGWIGPVSYPANCGNDTEYFRWAPGGPSIFVGTRALAAASLDPSSFTVDTGTTWMAWTVAVGNPSGFPGEPGGGMW